MSNVLPFFFFSRVSVGYVVAPPTTTIAAIAGIIVMVPVDINKGLMTHFPSNYMTVIII